MEEKKYLKWYNKVGYGSGDVGGNVVYALLAWGAPWFRDVGGPWVADWLARVVGA